MKTNSRQSALLLERYRQTREHRTELADSFAQALQAGKNTERTCRSIPGQFGITDTEANQMASDDPDAVERNLEREAERIKSALGVEQLEGGAIKKIGVRQLTSSNDTTEKPTEWIRCDHDRQTTNQKTPEPAMQTHRLCSD